MLKKYAVTFTDEEQPGVRLYVAAVAPAWGLFLYTEDITKAVLRSSRAGAERVLAEAANLLPAVRFHILEVTKEGGAA